MRLLRALKPEARSVKVMEGQIDPKMEERDLWDSGSPISICFSPELVKFGGVPQLGGVCHIQRAIDAITLKSKSRRPF